MRIMDALVKGMEKRGYKVGVSGQRWQRHTLVGALGCQFQLRLREPTVRRDHEPTEKEREWLKKYPGSSSVPKWDYALSNQLLLELQTESGWTVCTVRDGKKRRVEDNLSEILLAIARHADDVKRSAAAAAEAARERAEIERQRREEEERRRLEEQRRKEEQARVDALFAEAAQWDRCGQVREYLRAVRECATENCGFIEPDSQLEHWLLWADEVVDQCDPLIAIRREIKATFVDDGEAEGDAGAVNKPR